MPTPERAYSKPIVVKDRPDPPRMMRRAFQRMRNEETVCLLTGKYCQYGRTADCMQCICPLLYPDKAKGLIGELKGAV